MVKRVKIENKCAKTVIHSIQPIILISGMLIKDPITQRIISAGAT